MQSGYGTNCSLGADRQTLVVAVGGGVVGHLAGFVAATFARGIPFAQVPTTLLAQVDSSVGGKVGVNLPAAKNMVGAFWQPVAVLIDTQTLQTLPEREYRSGLAEVVKYGIILDAAFFARLEQIAPALMARRHDELQEVIARCCQLKADVVEADEREESGHRTILNYGHTFGHAFEALTGYNQLLHGEGVSIGMMCAARLAQRLGRVDAEFVRRQRAPVDGLELARDRARGRCESLDRRDGARQENRGRKIAVRLADAARPCRACFRNRHFRSHQRLARLTPMADAVRSPSESDALISALTLALIPGVGPAQAAPFRTVRHRRSRAECRPQSIA